MTGVRPASVSFFVRRSEVLRGHWVRLPTLIGALDSISAVTLTRHPDLALAGDELDMLDFLREHMPILGCRAPERLLRFNKPLRCLNRPKMRLAEGWYAFWPPSAWPPSETLETLLPLGRLSLTVPTEPKYQLSRLGWMLLGLAALAGWLLFVWPRKI